MMSISSQWFSPQDILLKSFVESYHLVESEESIEGYTIPNGRIDIVIVLKGAISRFNEEERTYDAIPKMSFFPLTKVGRIKFKVSDDLHLINIKCFPHVLITPIFNSLKLDVLRSFDEVFGMEASERLWKSLTTDRCIESYTAKLDDFFLRFLISPTSNTSLVKKVISHIESMNVDLKSIHDLAKTIGINPRTLDRNFRAFTGLSIKSYQDLVRFQKTAKEINQNGDYKHGNLMEALGSGYYDQSHFVKACKRISGMSPKELFTTFPTGFTDFFVKS